MSKRWGIPTWYFFHTFAEKITENHFIKKREECLNLLKEICFNLPCPYCRDHAKQYLKNNNFDNIRTKEQLKIFLFHFHNKVNKRKKNKEFGIEILEQYKKINIINAWKYFKNEFFRTYYMANQFSGWMRNMLLEKIIKFLKKNISQFHP